MIKLIRDNIPEIMKKEGKVCNYAAAQNAELFTSVLRDKLIEEVQEFLNANTVDELVDVTEVIEALVETAGVSKEEFEKAKAEKVKVRGGFTKRYICFLPDPQPVQPTEETK